MCNTSISNDSTNLQDAKLEKRTVLDSKGFEISVREFIEINLPLVTFMATCNFHCWKTTIIYLFRSEMAGHIFFR
jgi:hypothetical protein